MERLYSQFNPGERSVLRAIAQSGTIYGAEADLLDLSKGTATHARGALLDKGELIEAGDRVHLVTRSCGTGSDAGSPSERSPPKGPAGRLAD